jgi:hypothetical protein
VNEGVLARLRVKVIFEQRRMLLKERAHCILQGAEGAKGVEGA